MARNSGVLIGQLLGNRNNPCRLLHRRKLLIQNLTAVPSAPSSTQTIDIRSSFKPFSYYSLHTPNLQFLQQRRCLSSPSISDSNSKNLFSGHPNLCVLESLFLQDEALEKVYDDRSSAVFYYTAPGCRATSKWIAPIFDELCDQFPHVTMYKVYMDQNSHGCPLHRFEDDHTMNIAASSLDKLGIHKTPTFHCYLRGQRVDEIAGASIRHLKKRLENVYNPSGMKKGRLRNKKHENDRGDDLSQVVKVYPSSFRETSIPNVMLGLERVIWDKDYQVCKEMLYFAKGIFSCQEMREMFCNLKDDEAKLEWFKSELAEK